MMYIVESGEALFYVVSGGLNTRHQCIKIEMFESDILDFSSLKWL